MKCIVFLIMCAMSVSCYGMNNNDNNSILKEVEEKDRRIDFLEKKIKELQDENNELRVELNESTQFAAQLVEMLYAAKHGADKELLLCVYKQS